MCFKTVLHSYFAMYSMNYICFLTAYSGYAVGHKAQAQYLQNSNTTNVLYTSVHIAYCDGCNCDTNILLVLPQASIDGWVIHKIHECPRQ